MKYYFHHKWTRKGQSQRACLHRQRWDGIKRPCKARANTCGFEPAVLVIARRAHRGVGRSGEQHPVAAEGRHRGTGHVKGTHETAHAPGLTTCHVTHGRQCSVMAGQLPSSTAACEPWARQHRPQLGTLAPARTPTGRENQAPGAGGQDGMHSRRL